MNIGIDFDGVINTNNSVAMAFIEDEIAKQLGYFICNKNGKNSKERYGFNDSDYKLYQILRHDYINSEKFFSEVEMMTGATPVIAELNKLKHKTILVTARGCKNDGLTYDENVKKNLIKTLDRFGALKAGLVVDDEHSLCYANTGKVDKVRQCSSLGISLLIDDDLKNILKLKKAGFKTIHFGVDTNGWNGVIERVQVIDEMLTK